MKSVLKPPDIIHTPEIDIEGWTNYSAVIKYALYRFQANFNFWIFGQVCHGAPYSSQIKQIFLVFGLKLMSDSYRDLINYFLSKKKGGGEGDQTRLFGTRIISWKIMVLLFTKYLATLIVISSKTLWIGSCKCLAWIVEQFVEDWNIQIRY